MSLILQSSLMNNKIGIVTVYVNDQEQAKIFWMNKVVFF